MLENVSVDTFTPRIGEAFVVDGGELGPIALELASAELLQPGAEPTDSAGTRAPFSVRFSGPVEPMLLQGIHPLQNEAMGTLEIFVVPIGQDQQHTTYEAVFA